MSYTIFEKTTMSEIDRKKIIYILKNNNRWMTASEIISWGSKNGLMETKNLKSRQAKSHPVYRTLTAMIHPDQMNIYTPSIIRRVRKNGPDMGSYEYTFKGLVNTFRRVKTAIKTI